MIHGPANAPTATRTHRPRRSEVLIELERMLKVETDDCLLWPFGRSSNGYGLAKLPGQRTRTVHRIALERRVGPPTASSPHAAHSCRNRHCLNYRHLRWASVSENQQDRAAHGTSNRGERQWQSKLTRDDVREIRRLLSKGESLSRIGRRFGVSPVTVHGIKSGRSWGWLK